MMTPQAPSVYTFIDSSTQHRVSTAQNDSQVQEPVKVLNPQAPSVYTFPDSYVQNVLILHFLKITLSVVCIIRLILI